MPAVDNAARVAAIAARLRAEGVDDMGEALLDLAATLAQRLDAGDDPAVASVAARYREVLADLAGLGVRRDDDDPDAALDGGLPRHAASVRHPKESRSADARR